MANFPNKYFCIWPAFAYKREREREREHDNYMVTTDRGTHKNVSENNGLNYHSRPEFMFLLRFCVFIMFFLFGVLQMCCCCWYIGFLGDFHNWSVMWLTTVYRFIIYALMMLTIAPAERGRTTLKDDERFPARVGPRSPKETVNNRFTDSSLPLHLWKSVAWVNAWAGFLFCLKFRIYLSNQVRVLYLTVCLSG